MARKKARSTASKTTIHLVRSPTPEERAHLGAWSVSETEVERRAYEKWIARGCPLGDDARDWFDAQNELRREHTKNSGVALAIQ